MQRFLIIGAISLAVGGVGVTRFASLEERLASFDELRSSMPRSVASLRSSYDELDSRITEVILALEELETSISSSNPMRAELMDELSGLDEALLTTRVQVDEQRLALADLQAQQARWDEGRTMGARFEELEAGVQALEAGVDHRYDALTDVVRTAVTLAEDVRSEVEALRSQQTSADTSSSNLWDETMGPVVQLAGSSTVGSGILLPSRPLAEGGHETLLLTSWHVVRDIRAESSEERPIPVTVYERGGVLRRERAELLRHDADLDIALLRLESRRRMPSGARLASRETLRSVGVFDEVIAVGCPLGNDPIPTRGSVAEMDHRVDGNQYWMISAPTYIGNSGGGIFDANTHELIGVFSKIYTHGSLRPTVVPHMGLITPLEQVYDWIEEQSVAQLLPDATVGKPTGTSIVLTSAY